MVLKMQTETEHLHLPIVKVLRVHKEIQETLVLKVHRVTLDLKVHKEIPVHKDLKETLVLREILEQ